MYDALIMLGEDCDLTFDGLVELLTKVNVGDELTRSEERQSVVLRRGDSYVTFDWNEDEYVLVESLEIAESSGLPCRTATRRIETSGDDDSMELLSTWMVAVESLKERPGVVAYDPVEAVEWGT